MPIPWEKADSSCKYVAFFVFNPGQAAGVLRNSLKLRRAFCVLGRELNRSALGKVSKHAEMAFMKLNGKSEIQKR
jgi:hypothetical protein